MFAVLLVIERRYRLVKGQVFALYAALYTAGRFVWEEMRIDPAHTLGPLRVNAWVSLVAFTSAWALFFWLGHRKTTARPQVGSRQQLPSPKVHDNSVIMEK